MEPAVRPPRRPSQASWLLAIVTAAFIGGAASGAVVSLLLDGDGGAETSRTRVVTTEESAVTEAVAAAAPGIVTVVNERPPYVDDQGRIVEGVAVGSGVVLDARGYVVTNEHVVHDPGKISVVFHDGRERPAVLVSHDAPFTDLAVLRVPEGGLKALTLADSASLKIGQTVIAVGSALFEYRNSVTVGVVSGLGRRYLRENVFMEDLIQTDAAINSGNSGGPLLTTAGEVVGLTTNVVRRIGNTDNVYGIAFAISSRTMLPIVRSMIERGSYPRPYIGLEHLDVDSTLAAQRGLRIERGALVQRVVGGSPADTGGIRAGDVILSMGRQELNEDMPFINALARLTPQERVSVQVLRDGRALDLTVEIGVR